MMPREPPKVPCTMNVELDRISYLPGHIIDSIITQLSLRDAVRTSILSSKWRYKWFTIPHLVFDDQCVLASSQDQTVLKNKLVNAVDSVLLLHMGPIQKFKLSHRDLQGVSDIDRWILHLSRGPIKEFILEIWKGHRYKIPSSIYFSQMLIHLELFNCLLKPPPTFTGFRSLKSLDLQHITIEQQVFEHMISSCPLLERLTLMNFDGFTLLNIDAPNLQFFDIGGVFNDVHFQKTDCLAIVSIGLYLYIGTDQNLTLGYTDNLVKFFNRLPSIQRLEIQSYFLKYLAIGKIPVKLPNPCVELNYLSVRVNINDLDESLVVQCLLRSSPNLLELEILTRPDEQTGSRSFGSLWEEDYDCLMNQLQFVKVVGIVGDKCELDFIKFLLANSPTLERMTVKPTSNDKGWDLLKELVQFRRASVRAEIVYLDP